MRNDSTRASRGWGVRHAGLIVLLLAGLFPAHAAGQSPDAGLRPLLREYCLDCHGNDLAEARINLEALSGAPDFGGDFRAWEKVLRVLRQGRMPPGEMPQPEDAERQVILRAIDEGLDRFVAEHAGDPGPVVIRRLTSAEYAYTIRDLTGIDLRVGEDFVSDAVSGEGFTNAGGGQFMQDSTLERYLEAAKIVADHAMIGSGPLTFFKDSGRTGRELSAITRIQRIYREHGFRTAAGEGAEPFGLDLYPRALFVAWQYQHRGALGLGDVDLPDLARREGLSVRLCEHMWTVLQREDPPFPLSMIADRWRALPAPGASSAEPARAGCEELAVELRAWQRTLAAAAGDEEEAAVLTAGEVTVTPRHSLTASITWPRGADVAEFELSVTRAGDHPIDDAVVVWREPRVRFRHETRRRDQPRPLREFVSPESARRLAFGRHPQSEVIDESSFATAGEATIPVRLRIPEGMIALELLVDVELDPASRATSIVRCRIADGGEVEGETAAAVGDTSTLLADPTSPLVNAWREEVAEFARLLPEVSHREPAPSDRDPIPAPFDNAYNMPERNHFHTAIKYHRDDAFFVEHIADDATRLRLDHAWTDLLTAFEYHDANLRFVAEKFSLDLGTTEIEELEQAAIERLPAGPREFVQALSDEYAAMNQALRSAEPVHVADVLEFAARAWRRPLTPGEEHGLRAFHAALRDAGLDHEPAIKTLLARILVAPAFLYRAEPPTQGPGIVPLDDWQLASRLSYLIWSSMPDDALREAAAAGRLREPGELERQARRMLRDPKARRFATEFFGQWLGFYRFDQFQGIDTGRFPEFNDPLRAALYEEAIAFFEYVVREDRPVDEILFADYTFLNRQLAEHYGIPFGEDVGEPLARVDHVAPYHRGGLLGLGAVLTVTSAPQRTSAVKRGDWVLRRVVGTPVPPPPANVGSIPAEDVLSDGLTVRQRLEAHRSDASCVNCHARIDPLGFALEPFDPIGRRRETYRDGQEIDASGTLGDGTTIAGPDGLREYLRRERPQFHRTISAKLLGYALGRAELVSDRPLIEQMIRDLDGGGRFSELVARIVASESFRNQRVD